MVEELITSEAINLIWKSSVIHSDIERGFTRAECYHVDDLFTLTSEKAIKEAGKLRSEGKNYEMQDGDVVNFLFNV